ncbi:MAG: MFS transporter [Anaerolineae bacterium]|nr:MFS transporter [Anaerolineae bacterium]
MSTGGSGFIRREAVISSTKGKTSSMAAFQYPAYRTYFFGQLVSISGTWMQSIAQQVVVYNMTGSELALGLTAAAQGVPSLILIPFAGVIVERMSIRKLLIFTQTMMMILAFIQAALQFTGTLQVWHLIVLSFGLGMLNALDAPARQYITVQLVGRDHLPSGIALNAIMFNSARIIGPMFGGIALATVGAAWCFLLNGLSFIAVIWGLIVMHLNVAPRPEQTEKPEYIKPLIEGFQLARRDPVIGPLLLLSGINACLGISYATQIAPYAEHILHNVEVGTSALTTAQGVGTVIAAVAIARFTNSGKRGWILFWMTLIAPLGVIGLGLTSSFALSLPLAALASGGYICQFIIMNTLIQNVVPDDFRGRILSLYTLTFFGLGPFAILALGALAQEVSASIAMVVLGFSSLITSGFIVLKVKALRYLP